MFQRIKDVMANPNSASLVKNGSRLFSANVIAQAVGLAAYLYLSRVYSQEDFGLFNIFLTIGGILSYLTTAEYHNAIVLPKEDDKARALFHVGLRLLLVVTGIIVLTIPFAGWIGEKFNIPELTPVYWMLPFYVGGLGLWNLLNFYYNRRKAFDRMGGYQISQSLTSTGGKMAFGYFGGTQVGLIVSSVFAPLLSVAANVALGWKKHIVHLLVPTTKEERRSVAKEYKKFPIYSLPRTLVNNVSATMPVLLLTTPFGVEAMGPYGMATTLAFRPVTIITQSLYQVLLQRTNELVLKGQSIRSLILGYMRRSSLVVGIGFAGLYFLIPLLVRLICGAGWEDTITYVRIYLPWLFFSLVVGPVTFLCDIFKKQKIGLLFEILFFVMRFAGIGVGLLLKHYDITIGNFNHLEIAVMGYCFGGCLVIIFQLAWLISLVRNYERTLE